MCGRSSLTKTEKEIEERFNATFYSDELERYNPLPNYNITPTTFTPIITCQDQENIRMAHWGLIPSWSDQMKTKATMINARVETLLGKKTFQPLVKNQRCIVLLDGYYEWKKAGPSGTIPYRITWKEEKLFAMAGLYDEWIDEQNNVIASYTIITLDAPDFLYDIHPRVPAILTEEKEKLWLDKTLGASDSIEIIQPVEEQFIDFYTVSKRVNSIRNNDISLIEKVIYHDPGEQLSLF